MEFPFPITKIRSLRANAVQSLLRIFTCLKSLRILTANVSLSEWFMPRGQAHSANLWLQNASRNSRKLNYFLKWDFVHTQKRHPKAHTKDATIQWDFWSMHPESMHPESLHKVTILLSDREIPDGYRFMHGFVSHTFSMINSKNERFFVKYHFRSKQGIRNLSPQKAMEFAGSDPEHSQRDLFEAIERREFPRWGSKFKSCQSPTRQLTGSILLM